MTWNGILQFCYHESLNVGHDATHGFFFYFTHARLAYHLHLHSFTLVSSLSRWFQVLDIHETRAVLGLQFSSVLLLFFLFLGLGLLDGPLAIRVVLSPFRRNSGSRDLFCSNFRIYTYQHNYSH